MGSFGGGTVQTFIRWILKHAWIVLGITTAVSLFTLVQLRYLRVEDDITKYVPQNDPEVSFYNSLSDTFAGFQKKSMIVALEFDNLFTPENLTTLQKVVERIKALPVVQNVTALTNMPKIVTTDYGIEVKEVVDVLPTTLEEAQKLRQDLERDELIWGKLVTQDGKGTIVAISFYDGVIEAQATQEVEKEVNAMSLNVKITYFGFPIIVREISRSAQENMAFLTPLCVLVLLFILYLGFRNLQGVFIPIIIAFLAALWTLGAIVTQGEPLTSMSTALPVMLLALVTAYGIHFVNRYYEERTREEIPVALEKTMHGVFIPILMSALTTIAGFLSFLTANVKPISDLGKYAALGVFNGLILTLFSLAAFYRLFSPSQIPKHFDHNDVVSKKDRINWFLTLLSRAVLHHKRIVIGILVVIVIIFMLGIPQIQTETTVKMQMGENHPVTLLLEYFKNRFGSTDYNYLWISASQVREPFVLREMIRISQYASRYRAFKDASSIASFFIDLNQALDGWKAIPASQDKIDNLWFFAQDNDYIKGRMNDDGTETIIEFRAEETSSAELRSDLKALKTFLAQRPQKVDKVPVTDPAGKDALINTIIEDLGLFGIDVASLPSLKQIVEEFVTKPWEEFITKEGDFTSEVVRDALLEIEDLGLTTGEVEKALQNALLDGTLQEEILAQTLELTEDEASYLAGILANSIERVAKSRKVSAFRKTIETISGHSLGEKLDFVFYEVLDEEAYVPSPNGSLHIDYRITGTPVINDYVNSKLFSDQMRSMVLALLIVFALLIFQFRSIRKASAGIVPLLLTICSSFGIMGLFRIPLNVATLTIASIAIGAGVDYNIHFLSRWYGELNYRDARLAVDNTIRNTGRGILLNALGVAGGFYVLGFSRIGMLRMFGPLIATVLLLSAFYTLLVLPLILHLGEYFKNNREERGK